MQCLEPWVVCQALEKAPGANVNSPPSSLLLPPPSVCLSQHIALLIGR